MHKNVTRSERAILVAVLTLAGGCQLAQMQVSAPLDAVPALPVEPLVRKWSAPIRFGPWHSTSIDEGDTQWRPGRSRAAPQQSVQTLSLERSYRLVLAGAGPEISAACLMRLDVATYGHTSFDLGGARGDPFLRCKFDGALTGAMELFEGSRPGEAQAGQLDFDDVRWHIQSVDRIVGRAARERSSVTRFATARPSSAPSRPSTALRFGPAGNGAVALNALRRAAARVRRKEPWDG